MSEFQSKFDVTKTIDVKITVSDYEVGGNPSLTHSPERIIDNDNFDGSRRWIAHGSLHWIDFQFNQPLTVYGLDIAWYEGSNRKAIFEILSDDKILWKGMSTGSLGSYETYKFKDKLTTKNIRILCKGNTLDETAAITSVKFLTEQIERDGVQPLPECPEGQHWHDGLQRCVDNIITKSPNIIITEPLQTVKHSEKVMIDASKTADPQGLPFTYFWAQLGGESVMVNSQTQSSIIFTAPTIDTEVKFRLRAMNTANMYSEADTTIVVRAAIPQCPPGEVWDETSKRCIEVRKSTFDAEFPPQPKPAVKTKKRKSKWSLHK